MKRQYVVFKKGSDNMNKIKVFLCSFFKLHKPTEIRHCGSEVNLVSRCKYCGKYITRHRVDKWK